MNYLKDAFVLCKLKKKTRSRSGVAVDAIPTVTDLSPTLISDSILNHAQMLTRDKEPVEDYGGDYCNNDLEELIPEIDSSWWLDNSYQFDNDHWGSFADTTHSWEQGESSGLSYGENGHVYGQNTVHLEINRGILEQQGSGGPLNVSNFQHRPNLDMLTDWDTWMYQTRRAALGGQQRFSFNCFEDLKSKKRPSFGIFGSFLL